MRSRERIVDELLVLAAQARDVAAFERLAVRWHPRLLRHARRLTGDPDGARDAVQEAWVSIARGLPRLGDPARFGPWALRITSRRCADWIAARQRSRHRTADLGSPGDPPAAESAGPADERAPLREALALLDPETNALLAMVYVEGLSVAETAEALSIPVGTVKSRLFHARERLRKALEVSDGTQARR